MLLQLRTPTHTPTSPSAVWLWQWDNQGRSSRFSVYCIRQTIKSRCVPARKGIFSVLVYETNGAKCQVFRVWDYKWFFFPSSKWLFDKGTLEGWTLKDNGRSANIEIIYGSHVELLLLVKQTNTMLIKTHCRLRWNNWLQSCQGLLKQPPVAL